MPTADTDDGRPDRRGSLGPRRSWLARQVRARLVIEQLIVARYGRGSGREARADQDRAWQFYLQLRVLALLADLRAGHRTRTLDLRRRRRTCPPVALLRAATEDNGGLPLLRAISDIRSRRSEYDPLLVVAGVPAREDVRHRRADDSGSGEDGRLYEQWVGAVSVDQSPSRRSAWPWVLRPELAERGAGPGAQDRPSVRPPWWTWRWPYPALVTVLVVAAAAGVWQYRQHCSAGLVGGARDLVSSAGQCIGVDTINAAVFAPAGGGPGLIGIGASLASVEQAILAQNQAADQDAHVTIVYAGALSSSAATGAGQAQAAGSAGELAGVAAWQYQVNRFQGEKLRIDIANGGQDMAAQVVMAQKIAAAAAQDPTIIGVIGLARDTPTSPAVVQALARAGLVVVDTTNSDNTLAANWNYFGLAATNREEAAALRSQIPPGAGRPALIFEREGDRYAGQQAQAATRMLEQAGYRLTGPVPYPAPDDEADFGSAPDCGQRPAVVYLAGRADDVPNLMTMLQDQRGCLASQVTVLSGDDLTKYSLPGASGFVIPAGVRIDFAAITDIGQTGHGSSLLPDLNQALGLSVPGYCSPVFTDGTVGLGFDAARALYEAAKQESGQDGSSGRAAVPRFLDSMQLTGGATGTITPASPRHAIAIVRITAEPDGSLRTTPLEYLPSAGPLPA